MDADTAENKPVLSVITPAYNRAHLLDRAYDSLCAQSEPPLEWIIVDDGSTDGTAEKVEDFIKSGPFPVHYVYQENQGKHVAFNQAVRLAEGEFLVCLDSDDWFSEGSFASQVSLMKSYTSNPMICGVIGVSKRPDGTVIGKAFPEEGLIDSAQALGQIAPGDKAIVYKTEILKRFPFPGFHGELFVPQSAILNRMFQSGYLFVSTNTALQIIEYQEGGMTDTVLRNRINSLNSTLQYHFEMSLMKFPMKLRLRAQSNLVRFSLHKLGVAKFLIYGITMLPAVVIGALFYARDKIAGRSK